MEQQQQKNPYSCEGIESVDSKCASCMTESWQIFIIDFSSDILNWVNWYFSRNLNQIYTKHSANVVSRII